MFELPDLVIELISEYLSYKDLLNLRLTCKKLKQFVDLKEFRKLNLFFLQSPCPYNTFYAEEIVCYSNSFKIDDFKIFSSSKFKKDFRQIKKLIIFRYHHWDSRLDNKINIYLDELNHFSQLLHLEIDGVDKIEGKLNLENLKICHVRSYSKSFFELDCPNLNALKIGIEASPKLIMEENNLIHLSISEFLAGDDYLFSLLLITQNLSTICFKLVKNLISFLTEINQDRLNLPSLKQIQLKKINHTRLEYFDKMVSNLSILFKKHPKSHIKFSINNQFVDLNELIAISELFHREEKSDLYSIPDMAHLYCDDLKFLNENSTLLSCLLLNVISLDIDERIELDEKLMSKMKNLRSLELRSNFNLDKKAFQILFKTWPRLKMLVLKPFYNEYLQLDDLSMYFPHLSLLFLEKGCEIDDFNFICNLKRLEYLSLREYQIEKEVLISIFENCSDLLKVSIDGKHQQVMIYKRAFFLDCTAHNSKIFKEKKSKFDKLNDLIDYYYANNLFESEFFD